MPKSLENHYRAKHRNVGPDILKDLVASVASDIKLPYQTLFARGRGKRYYRVQEIEANSYISKLLGRRNLRDNSLRDQVAITDWDQNAFVPSFGISSFLDSFQLSPQKTYLLSELDTFLEGVELAKHIEMYYNLFFGHDSSHINSDQRQSSNSRVWRV